MSSIKKYIKKTIDKFIEWSYFFLLVIILIFLLGFVLISILTEYDIPSALLIQLSLMSGAISPFDLPPITYLISVGSIISGWLLLPIIVALVIESRSEVLRLHKKLVWVIRRFAKEQGVELDEQEVEEFLEMQLKRKVNQKERKLA